jgi:hypothetical protein
MVYPRWIVGLSTWLDWQRINAAQSAEKILEGVRHGIVFSKKRPKNFQRRRNIPQSYPRSHNHDTRIFLVSEGLSWQSNVSFRGVSGILETNHIFIFKGVNAVSMGWTQRDAGKNFMSQWGSESERSGPRRTLEKLYWMLVNIQQLNIC